MNNSFKLMVLTALLIMPTCAQAMNVVATTIVSVTVPVASVWTIYNDYTMEQERKRLYELHTECKDSVRASMFKKIEGKSSLSIVALLSMFYLGASYIAENNLMHNLMLTAAACNATLGVVNQSRKNSELKRVKKRSYEPECLECYENFV